MFFIVPHTYGAMHYERNARGVQFGHSRLTASYQLACTMLVGIEAQMRTHVYAKYCNTAACVMEPVHYSNFVS